MRPFASGGVSPVAAGQLAAWEAIARDWLTLQVFDADAGAWNERCGSCFAGLWRLADDHGQPYAYSGEDKLAMIVAHLRVAHLDLDPDPPADGA